MGKSCVVYFMLHVNTVLLIFKYVTSLNYLIEKSFFTKLKKKWNIVALDILMNIKRINTQWTTKANKVLNVYIVFVVNKQTKYYE